MLLRLLIFVAAIFILYKLFSGDRNKKREEAKAQDQQRHATGEMVKDPMCGAFVSAESDIRVRQGDKVHCFCSYECRDKYMKRLTETPKEG